MNRCKDYSLLILALGLAGCQPEKEVIHKHEFVYLEVEQEGACTYSSCGEPIEPEVVEPPQELIEEIEPDIPMIPLEPSTPLLHEFILNGLIRNGR